MHIVIWKYGLMEGKSRQDLLDAVEADARNYRNVPGLIRMYYGIAQDLRSVVEVFLWKSRSAADGFFSSEWDGETSRRWESPAMTRMDYEAPLVVEAEQGRMVTEAGR